MDNRLKDGFGMVSNTVLRSPEYSLGEKALYSYLCTYANKNDGSLFVGINKIADENNIGYSTALKYLSKLEKLRIITRKKRGRGRSSVIVILK